MTAEVVFGYACNIYDRQSAETAMPRDGIQYPRKNSQEIWPLGWDTYQSEAKIHVNLLYVNPMVTQCRGSIDDSGPTASSETSLDRTSLSAGQDSRRYHIAHLWS